MKKVILSLIVLAGIASSAHAQMSKNEEKKMNFSVGADFGIPTGNNSSIASFAVGGNLQLEYFTAPTFGLTLNAGYLSFSAKSGIPNISGIIPLLVGGRYYFTEKIYGSAQAGISVSTKSGGGSAFTYAPGIGFKTGRNFDILAKYQATTINSLDNSFVGVRLAYTFKTK